MCATYSIPIIIGKYFLQSNIKSIYLYCEVNDRDKNNHKDKGYNVNMI